MKSVALCAAALAFAATTAPAAVLYKSVAANGTVEFSDLVPEKGRSVERIRIPDSSGADAPATVATGPSREEQMRENDAAVARANAQLDTAEHALAEARRSVATDSDPLRMVSTRMSRADQERLAFYKKDVLLARAQLLEVLKEKRKAEVTAPVYTASNVWVPVNPGSRP
jgi:hypothetical protein